MSIFHYRGALPPDSSMFVGREYELATLLSLSKPPLESYAIIFGSRQLGKTSLIYRLRSHLPKYVNLALINLNPLGNCDISRVYGYLAEELQVSLVVRPKSF